MTARVVFVDRNDREIGCCYLGPNEELRLRLDLDQPSLEVLSGDLPVTGPAVEQR